MTDQQRDRWWTVIRENKPKAFVHFENEENKYNDIKCTIGNREKNENAMLQ